MTGSATTSGLPGAATFGWISSRTTGRWRLHSYDPVRRCHRPARGRSPVGHNHRPLHGPLVVANALVEQPPPAIRGEEASYTGSRGGGA